MHSLTRLTWRLAALVLVAPAAQAYIGPGAGLSAIGSALALVGALLLMIVGFVWYPVKRLMKRRKASAAESDTDKRDHEDVATATDNPVKHERARRPANEPATPKRP